MVFKIISIDFEGKAFAVDLQDRKAYHMANYRESFRQAVEVDYFPMNLQGVFIEHGLYYDMEFDTLEEARALAASLSIKENISNIAMQLGNTETDSKLTEALERVLQLYRDHLERYGVYRPFRGL